MKRLIRRLTLLVFLPTAVATEDAGKLWSALVDHVSTSAAINLSLHARVKREPDPRSEGLRLLLEDLILLDTLRLAILSGPKWSSGRPLTPSQAQNYRNLVRFLRENPAVIEAIPPGKLDMMDDPIFGTSFDKRKEAIRLISNP